MRQTTPRRSCRPTAERLESRALLTTYTVTTTGPGPGLTFFGAVEEANKHPGQAAIINFDIPGNGNHVITWHPLQSFRLPPNLTINGYSEPGSAPNTSQNAQVNNAQVTVTIATYTRGGVLILNKRNTSISGIRFTSTSGNFDQWWGVDVRADNVTVSGCAFVEQPNAHNKMSEAVLIRGGKHDTIGGGLDGNPAFQNTMSNYQIGVKLMNDSQHDAIVNNLIGGQPTPTDQQVGVLIEKSAKNNLVQGNVLYKNTTQLSLVSTNTIGENIEVPR